MSYDLQCERLARHFLRDYEMSAEERQEKTQRLAEQIQDSVESHLEALEHRRK